VACRWAEKPKHTGVLHLRTTGIPSRAIIQESVVEKRSMAKGHKKTALPF
jgi:hypothetical protein